MSRGLKAAEGEAAMVGNRPDVAALRPSSPSAIDDDRALLATTQTGRDALRQRGLHPHEIAWL